MGVVQSHVNIEHQYFCFVLFVLSFGMFKICLVPSKKGRLSGPLYPATCASGGVVLLYFSGESQYRFAVELGVAGAFARAPLLS